MDPIADIVTVLASCLSLARRQNQRRLLVLSGEREWSHTVCQQFAEQYQEVAPLWVSDHSPAGSDRIDSRQARELLGQEVNGLIYDCWAGLDPDALASLAGTLCGGGLLLLLTPPLDQWPEFEDPDYQRLLVHPFQAGQIPGLFLTHFVQSLFAAKQSLLIEQGQVITIDADHSGGEVSEQEYRPVPANEYCLTEDQATAVAAIIKVAQGHRKRPLVMRADRGRGKSSALGIASARLMAQGGRSIIITAPRIASVAPVFQHAARLLAIDGSHSNGLQFGDSCLTFVAADALLQCEYSADLLLVDEAAAIPALMLEQLLLRYSRVVFSTTVHGYEGTGRGFDLRFRQTLDKRTPQWRALQLSQPIRWLANDPVERWLFDSLLLDAGAAEDQLVAQASAKLCCVDKLDREALIADKALLKQLFGLLLLAHYQTTPSDLRNLLDGPNISVWVTRFRGQVVAAALISSEGGFDEAMSAAVWRGERRPRGHMLPQTLCVHAGLQQAAKLRYQRVMRIAVHPAAQRRGLGQQLMAAIVEGARQDHYDLIGSSFAATTDVLAFWRSAGCVPVRLGVGRDASSGCHSVVVLSALTEQGGDIFAIARERFNRQFPHDLSHVFQQLDAELAGALLSNTETLSRPELDQQDWLDVEAYAKGYRQYEACTLALWLLVCRVLSHPEWSRYVSVEQEALLIRKVLQHQTLKQLVKNCGLSGKKELQKSLRAAVAEIYHYRAELGLTSA